MQISHKELALKRLEENRKLKFKLKSLQMKTKSENNFNIKRCDVLDILGAERYIMKFLNGGTEYEEQVKSIKEFSLFDFWKWLQEQKDDLETLVRD